MLKLLFLIAVTVSELTNIPVEDVDLGAYKIFSRSGRTARTSASCFRSRSD
jgi:hypothetical protein